MAAYRVLELNLISATDLKKVTVFSRMRVYAVASISGGDPRMPTHGTQADRYGGCSPAWNAVFHFPIPAGADTRGLGLHVLLRADRVLGARDVGEVFVPVDDLLAGADVKASRDPRPATYQVRRPRSGRAHGVLYFSYKFIDVPAAGAPAGNRFVQQGSPEKATAAAEKVVVDAPAHPPPAHYQQAVPYGSAYAGYPTQPSAYPYVAPQPYGYSAAPQPATYGYAAAPAPAKKHGGGMGMGLGLGLLGGAVGGMMVGEMIGDAAHDAGFNDALEL